MSEPKAKPPAAWFSESLARGLSVLRVFSRYHARLSVSEVAELSSLSRAAARRYLLTLQDLGYVGAERDRYYLRPRVLDLGYGFLSSTGIEELAEPVLQDIAQRAEGASHLAIFDNWQVLIAASVPSPRMRNVFTVAGGRLPAYVGSLGPVLLAWLPEATLRHYLERTPLKAFTESSLTQEADIVTRLAEVRAKGYAVNKGEYTEGIVGVAIPLRNRSGQVVAALNVNRFSGKLLRADQIKKDLGVLREAAAHLEAALQTTGGKGLSLEGPPDI
jgi:IclR family transcriptional regulator, pca regulon regulatory protein